MRLTVTPLGASGQSASGVAAAVVNYLEGEAGGQGPSLFNRPVVSAGLYYADSIEGPGRWLGAGAAFRDLDGAVGRDEFQRVLEGRHPSTGERLVTAQGSSQRGHLSVGTAARTDESGGALYTVRDVARLLGVTRADIEEMIRIGDDRSDREAGDASWIASTLHPVDGPLISDHEVSRHLELAARPIDVGSLTCLSWLGITALTPLATKSSSPNTGSLSVGVLAEWRIYWNSR